VHNAQSSIKHESEARDNFKFYIGSYIPNTQKHFMTRLVLYLLYEKLTSIPGVVRLSWLENAYSRSLLWMAILTRKVGKTDVVFLVCNQGSSVGLCIQDYKSL